MSTKFALLLFATAGLTAGLLWWLGWLLLRADNRDALDAVTARIQFLGLIGASVATLVAVVGAYYTFFTPFTPTLTVGSYSWRLRPVGSPNAPFEVAVWVSASNSGVTPGEIANLYMVVKWPKGDWLLEPLFFVDSPAYLKAITNSHDSPDLPLSEPFAPLFIQGRGQVSKAILFMPFNGMADFSFIEPGMHTVSIYSRERGGKATLVRSQKIIFEADRIQEWRNGTTIGSAHFHNDKSGRELLREAGVELRTGVP